MLYLKKLNAEDRKYEYEFFKNMPSENGFENEYADMSYVEFQQFAIPQRLDASKGINLQQGYVPDTYYFLWKEQEIIGLFKIRHELNDFLRNGPGHIGFGILPNYRNKGYASKGLALAIETCKQIVLNDTSEIYLSCLKNNPASLQVMLKNGAYIHHEDENEYYVRIPIR